VLDALAHLAAPLLPLQPLLKLLQRRGASGTRLGL
jgi:hypothetical protein